MTQPGNRVEQDLAEARDASETDDTFAISSRLVHDYMAGDLDAEAFFEAVDALARVVVQQELALVASRREEQGAAGVGGNEG